MVNFWKMTVELVKEQRDQYKAERDALIEENKKLKEENEKLEAQKIIFRRSYKQAIEENKRLDKQLEFYKKAYEKMHEGWFKYRELKTHIFSLADRSSFNKKYLELIKYINELDEDV